MKVRVSEASGSVLDWMVAKCEGHSSFDFWHTGAVTTRLNNGITITHYYSTDWSQGGPIIERERISIADSTQTAGWYSEHGCSSGYGPTPLIAAMRCYVMNKLGDEVDVPEELLK